MYGFRPDYTGLKTFNHFISNFTTAGESVPLAIYLALLDPPKKRETRLKVQERILL